ncbi:MAG: hypothetical protein J7K29_03745 [Candidatus Cloacimonetes bacterium]|nr:hypothetical protein [Candidatus Cloacimonadota bacterium]
MMDKATLTITLAELYENQHQYIDALMIYKILFKENQTEKLQNKIDELKDKIFDEDSLDYSSIIDQIFTKKEKKIFNILPHKQYKTYKESQIELKNEETYPEEFAKEKEKEITITNTSEDDISLEEINQPVNNSENKILNLLIQLSHLKPDTVEKILKENVGSDTSLAEIKLSDLNSVIELLKVSENVERDQRDK